METIGHTAITLGVTGGIGAGKSAVCAILERLGARIFRADEEGKRILADDAGARREIVAAFGEESYLSDGSVNRAFLAETVFGDPGKVAVINGIVHPRVAAAFEEARRNAERDGVQVLVKEAALIFESGGESALDAVVVVDAPEDERIRRVVERDSVSEEKVRERMEHQLPAEELRCRADYLIDNSGGLGELESDVWGVLAHAVAKLRATHT